MTRLIETDDSGALTIAPEQLGDAKPHARFVVEAVGETVMLRPEAATALLPRDLPPEERAREFREWVASLPPGPGPVRRRRFARGHVRVICISPGEGEAGAMTSGRLRVRGVATACTMAIALLLSGPALAQTDASYHWGKRTLRLATRCAAASRLAHERYRFLQEMRSSSPSFMWCMPGDYDAALLFPFTSSARAYSVVAGAAGDLVSCWRRKGDRYTYEYVIPLDGLEATPRNVRPKGVRSHLGSIDDWLAGYFSRSVEAVRRYVLSNSNEATAKDMAARRSYVVWSGRWSGISVRYACGLRS